MNTLQKVVLAIAPRSIAQQIAKESRLWKLVCPTCQHETSVWDAGGIRYLATGRPRRLYKCPQCGLGLHTVVKRD